MPSHQSLDQLRGRGLGAIHLRGNGEADRLAALGAALHAVPAQVVEQYALGLEQTSRLAAWTGQVLPRVFAAAPPRARQWGADG